MITLEPDCPYYHLLRYPAGVEGSQDRRVVGLLLLFQVKGSGFDFPMPTTYL